MCMYFLYGDEGSKQNEIKETSTALLDEENLGQSTSSKFNPTLARLYKKFIRFLIFRRIAQLIVIGSFVLAIDGEIQYFQGQTGNGYPVIAEADSWLQATVYLTAVWYSWIPFRFGKDIPDSLLSSLNPALTVQTGGFHADQDKSLYE